MRGLALFSYQLSAISYQLSAISYQLEISGEPDVVALVAEYQPRVAYVADR